MKDLDTKGIVTNFVARDLTNIPKHHPIDMNPFAALEKVTVLERRIKAMEESLSCNKADTVILQDKVTEIDRTVATHERLISNGALTGVPKSPLFSDIVNRNAQSSKQSINDGNRQQRAPPLQHQERTLTRTKSRDSYSTNRSVRNDNDTDTGNDTGDNNESNQNDSSNKWITVTRCKPIQGRATGAPIMGAPEPSRSYFVYRVNRETDDEQFTNYLKSKGLHIRDFKLVSHRESVNKSYKLVIPKSDQEIVMNDQIWPRGICVRPFYTKRLKEVRPNNGAEDNENEEQQQTDE